MSAIISSVMSGLQMLREFADEVVPLIIPAKGGEILAIRAVLTKSKEDKEILKVVSKSQLLIFSYSQSSRIVTVVFSTEANSRR